MAISLEVYPIFRHTHLCLKNPLVQPWLQPLVLTPMVFFMAAERVFGVEWLLGFQEGLHVGLGL